MPTDVAEINKVLIEDIFRIYADAENQMLEKVAKRVKRGVTDTGWNEIKLKDILTLNEEIKKLLGDTGKLSKGHLNKGLINAYKKGINGASLDFSKIKPGKIPKTALARVNIPLHLQRLLLESHNMVDRASIEILRNIQDVYRDVMAEATTGLLTGVETRLQASQNALNKFAAKGVTGFIDKAGRKWELASYVEMATRTASAHAALQGHVDRMLELDWDLMIVSSHANTCPLCAPWGGKVLSITGKTPGYDTMDMAKSAGLFHPNCKHTITAYFPFIDEPEDHVHDKGYNPEKYEAMQIQRYNERQIRKWKRVEAVALTPSEKIKAQNQIKKWQSIQREHVDKFNLRRKYGREGIRSRIGVTEKAKDDLIKKAPKQNIITKDEMYAGAKVNYNGKETNIGNLLKGDPTKKGPAGKPKTPFSIISTIKMNDKNEMPWLNLMDLPNMSDDEMLEVLDKYAREKYEQATGKKVILKDTPTLKKTSPKPKISKQEQDIEELKKFVDLYEKMQPQQYGKNSTIEDVKKHSKLLQNVSHKKREAIVHYTGGGHIEYNNALRSGFRPYDDDRLKEQIQMCKEVIKEAPPLSEDTILYRHDYIDSVKFLYDDDTARLAAKAFDDADALEELKTRVNRSTFKDKGFLSTSYAEGIFTKENGMRIQIYAKKGFKNGVFVEDISNFDNEREYIIGPSQKFRVIDVTVDDVRKSRRNDVKVKNLIFHVVPI